MYSYESLREKHGRKVSQTIDSPILVFDYWELSDVFIAVGVVLVFGVILYAWLLMMALLLLVLGVGPVLKRKNHRGIFFHWPYRHFGMSLPGLVNPGRKKKYSD